MPVQVPLGFFTFRHKDGLNRGQKRVLVQLTGGVTTYNMPLKGVQPFAVGSLVEVGREVHAHNYDGPPLGHHAVRTLYPVWSLGYSVRLGYDPQAAVPLRQVMYEKVLGVPRMVEVGLQYFTGHPGPSP
ncbi:carboxypeptidase y [Lasius niger]|uniref:Carboxypeptidase y n=1 Tax=Lasius niger TaxID=67767 RepID=A0A0J7JVL6_LASNI|nr:carboxypeptidase y [Lasius niger]